MVLLGQLYAAPESPRFLIKRQKFDAAYETLLGLRKEPILAAKELLYAYRQMLEETRLLSSDREKNAVDGDGLAPMRLNYTQKLSQLFKNPRNRRALIAAVVLMTSQQLCGVNALIFFSSTTYGNVVSACSQADSADRAANLTPLWLTWGVGLINFLFAIPGYWLIERRGRRLPLLISLPFMALCMLIAGLGFLIPNAAQVPVVGVFTYLFMMLYSWGMGPVPFTYSAECFPLEVRMVGMSLSVFSNFLGAGLLALFVPALTQVLGNAWLLIVFAALNIVAFVLVFLLVPETAAAAVSTQLADELGIMLPLSLEELHYIFRVNTKTHIEYQFEEVVKGHFYPKYILRQKNVRSPRKLYKWHRFQQQELQRRETSATQPETEEREQAEPAQNGAKTPEYLHLHGLDGSGRMNSARRQFRRH